MLKVVSNSTPLIALASINRLDILEKLYQEVFIPKAVMEEVSIHEKVGSIEIQKSKFIKVIEVKNKEAKQFFQTSLHDGEVETIILYREMNADLCIIDDLLARKYAKYHDIKITGTLGVLLKAKEKKLISQLNSVMDELIKNGIFIDEKLYELVLKIEKQNKI
jgi:predicted nucleic acid-binding protein